MSEGGGGKFDNGFICLFLSGLTIRALYLFRYLMYIIPKKMVGRDGMGRNHDAQ